MNAPERPAPATLTPEHLQLLSDARLRALAEPTTEQPAAMAGPDSAWQRLARYELKRRHGASRRRLVPT